MIKNGVVWAIIGLFLISGAYALSEEKIYETWVIDGDSLTVNNESFSVMVDDSSQERTLILLRFNKDSFILKNGSCNIRGGLNYCFEPDVVLGEYNYEKTKYVRKGELIIFQLVANLQIEREIQKRVIVVGEETRITTLIKNYGKFDAKNVVFKDSFPKENLLIKSSDCSNANNEIMWEGNIKSGETKTCSYTIKALQSKKFRSQATVNYFNGIGDKSDKDTQNIEIPSSYISVGLNTGETREALKEERSLEVKIENKKSDSITPKIVIEFPEGIEIIKYENDDFEKKENKLTFDSLIEGKGKKSYNITLKSNYFGDQTIKANVEYEANNIKQEFKKETILKSENIMSLEIKDNMPYLIEGSTKLVITVKNPTQFTFNNIEVLLNSNILKDKIMQEVDKLPKNYYREIATIEFWPEKDYEYYYEVDFTYETEFGQRFQSSKKRVLKVNETHDGQNTITRVVKKEKRNWFLPVIIVVCIFAAFIAYMKMMKKVQAE